MLVHANLTFLDGFTILAARDWVRAVRVCTKSLSVERLDHLADAEAAEGRHERASTAL